MSNKLSHIGLTVMLGVVICLCLPAGPARADYMWSDTNHDGMANSLDIDAIYQNLTVAPIDYPSWPRPLVPYNVQYDLNGDGLVSQADVTYELVNGFHTTYGDFNLNRTVDFLDYQDLLDHMNQPGGWAQGDINGDGIVNYLDWADFTGVKPGDANKDGKVDFLDFQSMLDEWQQAGPGLKSDFNHDGVVDFLDFQLLLDYWNPTGYAIVPLQAPEPATLTLLAIGGLALLRRGRKV